MHRLCLAILFGIGLVLVSLACFGTAQSALAVTSPTGTQPPFNPAYPRLGMWWPDTYNQPITDIARYDWVIFGDWEKDRIPAIKNLHPQLLALNSTNACELGFNPSPEAEPWENREVRDIPAEWFLTQVGSTLRQDVDATQTVLPVNAITVTDGTTTYALFIPKDTAVIEGESVYVKAVDSHNKTLTVQRGYVRPAAAHQAGARIAAHVTFWPNSWVLNVSTLCPTATVSPSLGPETWAEYNARQAAALLEDPLWDGILLDRSDPNESWLIGNSTARTLDPDQSNQLLSDYQDFDAAWNAGLRQYESRLRAAVGDQKIIFVNWGMPNYDLLNGNNFEGFPDDAGTAYGTPWRQKVFGPDEEGSYFEWLEKARQPNLTMIETYEDDGGPDPTSDEEYDNPCIKPGFVPNYRKMRYGLATALLNDGFFSYEINTNGHGSLCLMWFDEYDNAGQGRGYLGQPLGPAQRAIPVLPSPNLVKGGDFESSTDLNRWRVWVDNESGYSATLSLDKTDPATGTAAARLQIGGVTGEDWRVSFYFKPTALVSGTEYTLSFWAKADRPRTISAWAQADRDPWETWLWYDESPLGTGWQFYEAVAMASGSDGQARLIFGLGAVTGTVWLDGVRLQAGNRDVWRRDFTGGLVLINTTPHSQTIPLGGAFQRINGRQDAAVNNGSLVTEVTLPSSDGLVLLHPPAQVLKAYLPIQRK